MIDSNFIIIALSICILLTIINSFFTYKRSPRKYVDESVMDIVIRTQLNKNYSIIHPNFITNFVKGKTNNKTLRIIIFFTFTLFIIIPISLITLILHFIISFIIILLVALYYLVQAAITNIFITLKEVIQKI